MNLMFNDLQIRDWHDTDAARLAEIADNRAIADNLTDGFPSPYTINDAKKYIAAAQSSQSLLKAICRQDTLVGSIAIMFRQGIYCKSALIAYFIAESEWGKGIASRSIAAITDYVFGHHDIRRISAEPFERNIGSQKALRNAGFQLEGILRNSVFKNGELINSCLYAKIR